MQFAEHIDELLAALLVGFLVDDRNQRARERVAIAGAQLERLRPDPAPWNRRTEFVRQPRDRSSLVCLLKAAHEFFSVLRRRGQLEESRAGEEIPAGARGGKAAHQPAEKLLLHDRNSPEGRILE